MRRKQRTVPVSGATLDALRAHWADRDRDFDGQAHGPLIAPVWIPETDAAQNRHTTDDRDVAYTPDALGRWSAWPSGDSWLSSVPIPPD
ncbi:MULTISPECIES: hypothetical protein [unclassified Caballeronia]|uniref:hypothetical protein n=1 Tax=unclassified Caballeronia TaxID=2646786 RepID=UPI002854E3AC|nr:MULTISPECIES: hypothetical protein [unclassified Caballeronia]MDR5777765.1 hypothetical protein [Caballeronia sp. LZ002]MDR5853200.1 hypothetical protein [Caballeronia sp. LZ003]